MDNQRRRKNKKNNTTYSFLTFLCWTIDESYIIWLQEVVCNEITAFGVENETGDIYNIVEENENNIVGEWINEGNDVELIFSFTVTTNGDLELYFYNDNGDAEIESIYTRLATSPCN